MNFSVPTATRMNLHYSAAPLSFRGKQDAPDSPKSPDKKSPQTPPETNEPEDPPVAKTLFQKIMLGLCLLGAGTVGYQIYKHTPHNPPVVAVDEIPVSKAMKTLEGVVMTGAEPNSFIIRDMGSQRIYSLRDIDDTKLSAWFHDWARVSVRGTRGFVEVDGKKQPRLLVDTIDPAHLIREVPAPQPRSAADKAKLERVHLVGFVEQDETTKLWTLTDDKTGEKVILSGHTESKLAAWFRHNVAVQITGKDSRKRDNVVQGLPFNVETIRPVQSPVHSEGADSE